MSVHRGVTIQVTAFYVGDVPSDGVTPSQPWLAIASTHVYDATVDTGGLLTPEQAIIAGEVMREVSGKASAASEAAAVVGAVHALFVQLEGYAAGGIANAES